MRDGDVGSSRLEMTEHATCDGPECLLGGMAQTAADRPEPLLRAGNTNCGGCGMSVALNLLSHAIGTQHRIQMVIPACCGIVTAGPYPYSNYGAPVLACTFASTAAVATGLARAAQMNGESTRVVAWAGDGGTYDIGMATLSAAAERNEDVLYICYDNEIYGNTGGQRSSATPTGARTTTTPGGKVHHKKDILGIMAAHRIPLAASISLAHPGDAVAKMERALALEGFRFLHVLAPCPTGWKSEPADGIELIRMAVRAGLFPVCQVEDGRRWTIDVQPTFSRTDLAQYFELQGRFRGTALDIEQVARQIEEHWSELRALAAPRG
ncbi:MAG: pyruvate synthase subunit beta [Planctomycetes bacterium]|nr:pyruvate synthase subunit beta [Planctomycetota bacterium]